MIGYEKSKAREILNQTVELIEPELEKIYKI